MRLEAVTECEHGEVESCGMDRDWTGKKWVKRPSPCLGGSRREASTTDLITDERVLAAFNNYWQSASEHVRQTLITEGALGSWRRCLEAAFSLEGEK